MKLITCFRLESRGEQYNSLIARFKIRTEAEIAGKIVGGYGPNIRAEEIRIYDTAYEFNPTLDEESKATGLAKLTDTEKAALGLKGEN